MTRRLLFGDVPPEFASYDGAGVVIVPVRYEATTTYGKGTENGPEAIIRASTNMELYDEETSCEPFKIGIHTHGELNLDRTCGEDAVGRIEGVVDGIIRDGKLPIVLGGEHTITLGCVRAAMKHSKNLTVIQLDAHADLRDIYDNTPFSHACVMRRIVELGLRTVQVGIRSLSIEEAGLIREKNLKTFWAKDIFDNESWFDEVVGASGDDIYLTIDVDVFDPSVIPSTGTPEPGGLTWYQIIKFLKFLMERKRLIACDIVELAPVQNLHAPDFTTARLVYKIIAYYGINRSAF